MAGILENIKNGNKFLESVSSIKDIAAALNLEFPEIAANLGSNQNSQQAYLSYQADIEASRKQTQPEQVKEKYTNPNIDPKYVASVNQFLDGTYVDTSGINDVKGITGEMQKKPGSHVVS